ncbi:hypothetical protein LXL04_002583 [Taraxacum kok-saghyz]
MSDRVRGPLSNAQTPDRVRGPSPSPWSDVQSISPFNIVHNPSYWWLSLKTVGDCQSILWTILEGLRYEIRWLMR